MSLIVWSAYLDLVKFDLWRIANGFPYIYKQIGRVRVNRPDTTNLPIERLSHAVDVACIWYWKEVLCLQRSVTLAGLLRKRGINADVVIGVHHSPFRSHAWVEVDGIVIGDKRSVVQRYKVLDRW
jgi:hypothetical protein